MFRHSLIALVALLLLVSHSAFAQTAPDIHIVSFGAEKGYAVGTQNVTLLCVVKNEGNAPLPEKTLRVRCFALSGLDYLSGETRPILPQLAPKQSVAFRWQLSVRDAKTPLVVGALVEAVGTLPPGMPLLPGVRSAIATIPRLTALPTLGSTVPKLLDPPFAASSEGEARIGNDRVLLKFVASDRRPPVLIIAAREETAWRTLALGTPLIEVLAGEEGQQAWWEGFRWRTTLAQTDRDSASLRLDGTLGTRWKATLTFEAKRDTGAIDVILRLTAVRPIRIYGMNLPRLLTDTDKLEATTKADGSALAITYNEPILPEKSLVVALREGTTTYGLSYPANAPFPNGTWEPHPLTNSALYPVLGVQWTTPAGGFAVASGTTLEIPFRLFALSPSETVKDALRFVMP